MKRILTYILLLLAPAACSHFDESIDGSGTGVLGEGAVRMSLSVPRNADASQYDPLQNCSVKIYKYIDGEAGSGERSRGLVRKYDSAEEMPQQIWLLAGDYAVTVEVGGGAAATTLGKSYAGSADFTVEAGIVEKIEVECKLRSSIVAVKFDESVRTKLPEDAHAWLSIDEEFDLGRVQSGEVPALRFDEDGEGYFMMPDGLSDICWYFRGEGDELGVVERTGTIAGVKPAVKYTLTFRYSKDPNGMLSFEVGVDESEEIVDDTVTFSPDPTIKGDGFSPAEEQRRISGSYTYAISALSEISEISVTTDGSRTLLPLTEAVQSGSMTRNGITVTCRDAKNYDITLTDGFFAPLTGGAHEVTIYVADTDGGDGECTTLFRTQGVMPIGDDYDLWYGTATIRAEVLDPTVGHVAIEYREKGSESWTAVEAAAEGGSTEYAAQAKDFEAGAGYEYRLTLDAVPTGMQLEVQMPEGQQLPNADFERWSQSGAAYYPYAAGDTPFWDTGNPGATTLGESYNLTNKNTDTRPESKGTYSAYMHSAFPNMLNIGKFAAGNIFVGKFAGTAGTNGLVDFGQPYTFTARPKAMKFWYKNFSGKIDKEGDYRDASGNKVTGQNDHTHIFIALCKWDRPHRVDTRDTKTFFDPRTVEGMVGCGFFETTESCETWTEKTLNIEYRSDEKPNYLVIVFTCSAYGDYFTGSTQSWMYVDDVELVYR